MITQQIIENYKITQEVYQNLREPIYERIGELFNATDLCKEWNIDSDVWEIDFERGLVIIGLHYDDEKHHWSIKLSDFLNPDYLNELIEAKKKKEEDEKKKIEKDKKDRLNAVKKAEYQTYQRLKKKFEK